MGQFHRSRFSVGLDPDPVFRVVGTGSSHTKGSDLDDNQVNLKIPIPINRVMFRSDSDPARLKTGSKPLALQRSRSRGRTRLRPKLAGSEQNYPATGYSVQYCELRWKFGAKPDSRVTGYPVQPYLLPIPRGVGSQNNISNHHSVLPIHYSIYCIYIYINIRIYTY